MTSFFTALYFDMFGAPNIIDNDDTFWAYLEHINEIQEFKTKYCVQPKLNYITFKAHK